MHPHITAFIRRLALMMCEEFPETDWFVIYNYEDEEIEVKLYLHEGDSMPGFMWRMEGILKHCRDQPPATLVRLGIAHMKDQL
jgi:hypothetical protein